MFVSLDASAQTVKKAAGAKATTVSPAAPATTTTAATTTASAAATPETATPAVQPTTAAAGAATPAAGHEGSATSFTWSTPFTLERVSASIGPEFGSNDLNLGIGARGGYTIRQAVYFGLLADYWFGSSQDAVVPGGGRITQSVHGWDVFGDVGYDLAPTPTLVIRPFVGFGIFGSFGEACTSIAGAPTTTCISEHGSKGAGLFGGQVLAELGSINLGGELRVIIAGDAAVVLAGRVGTTF
jgi:hypothetical protein